MREIAPAAALSPPENSSNNIGRTGLQMVMAVIAVTNVACSTFTAASSVGFGGAAPGGGDIGDSGDDARSAAMAGSGTVLQLRLGDCMSSQATQ